MSVFAIWVDVVHNTDEPDEQDGPPHMYTFESKSEAAHIVNNVLETCRGTAGRHRWVACPADYYYVRVVIEEQFDDDSINHVIEEPWDGRVGYRVTHAEAEQLADVVSDIIDCLVWIKHPEKVPCVSEQTAVSTSQYRGY